MYDPSRDLEARYRGWRVIERPLRGAYGVMLYRRRLIIVDSEASPAERDCTIAHEVVHLDRGDRCTMGSDLVDQRRELAVIRETARRMLCVERVAQARPAGRFPADVAAELGVDLDTLRAFREGLTVSQLEYLNRLDAQDGAA